MAAGEKESSRAGQQVSRREAEKVSRRAGQQSRRAGEQEQKVSKKRDETKAISKKNPLLKKVFSRRSPWPGPFFGFRNR